MRMQTVAWSLAVVLGVFRGTAAAAEGLPPIERVEIRTGRAFYVNGEPFFPLMGWLQDAENFPALKACGMNATAGYWSGSSGTKNVSEYLTLIEKAGLYGVVPFDSSLKGRRNLLGYIHDDEPDLPRQVSDAEVIPSARMKVNRKTPLWKLVDGVSHSWSVLDPLDGAAVTIRLKRSVTVQSLAVWLTVSKGLPLAKDVSFEGDGREILKATLEARKGQQKFALSEPATFRELKMTIHATFAGEQVWGSIGEIEGFDADGENLLLAPPRHEPRARPPETLEKHRAIKTADPSRPVFMTLTGHFHPHFQKWTDRQRDSLYPAYVAAADVVGYDIYPIYGWNKPQWIYLVHDATERLVELAGTRPVYAWIETSRGGQWTGPLEGQTEVTPAHIRAEVWMAICRGATAIGYFTHVWKPSYAQFGVPEENRKAIREINGQITRLTPAILGRESQGTVTIEAGSDAKLDVMAKEHDGKLYVFAVNYDERLVKSKATVGVKDLPAGTQVTVLDEDRTICSKAGSFADEFEPLAVHVYRIDRP